MKNAEYVEDDIRRVFDKHGVKYPDKIIAEEIPHQRVGIIVYLRGLNDDAAEYDLMILEALLGGDFDTDVISYTFSTSNNFREVDDDADGPTELRYVYIVEDYLS